MICNDFSSIDFSKYKRVFTFGCSFTYYLYPTWANIIQKNMPDAEFYNLGACGGGNMFISNRLTEANRKFKFNEDDLVMVLWSTFTREDRFVNGAWTLVGNVYSQDRYDSKFVKDNCDPIGYLIKDLSLIDLSLEYMKSLPATCVSMMSVPVDTHQINEQYYDWVNSLNKNLDIATLYQDILDMHNVTLLGSLPGRRWPSHIKYYDEIRKQNVTEYHPSPKQYYEYLVQLGFNLSDSTREYAFASETTLQNSNSRIDITERFKNDTEVVINDVHASATNGFINWL